MVTVIILLILSKNLWAQRISNSKLQQISYLLKFIVLTSRGIHSKFNLPIKSNNNDENEKYLKKHTGI